MVQSPWKLVATKIVAIQEPESGPTKWHSEGQTPVLGKLTHIWIYLHSMFLKQKLMLSNFMFYDYISNLGMIYITSGYFRFWGCPLSDTSFIEWFVSLIATKKPDTNMYWNENKQTIFLNICNVLCLQITSCQPNLLQISRTVNCVQTAMFIKYRLTEIMHRKHYSILYITKLGKDRLDLSRIG